MKLYFSKAACSLVVRIIINELGLDCEYESVDLRAKKTASGGDYLQINPKGAVPALAINHQEVLTENAVILQYLADKHQAYQLLPKVGDDKRYRVLEWVNYITTEMHKGFSPLFNPSLPQEIKETIVIPALRAKFTYVDKHLEDAEYLMGDHFTLPDAYLYVMLRWARGMKFDLAQWPNLSRFLTELHKRPSVAKSLSEEGLEMI